LAGIPAVCMVCGAVANGVMDLDMISAVAFYSSSLRKQYNWMMKVRLCFGFNQLIYFNILCDC
jgi:hypothetical protein